MKRLLVAALAAVWLAVPAGAAPIIFSLYSDDGECRIGWEGDTFACHARASFTLNTLNAGETVFLDKQPGNLGGRIDVLDLQGNVLETGGITTDWFGIPWTCATQCAKARMNEDYDLTFLQFTWVGSGFFNTVGSLAGWEGVAGGDLDLYGEGTWTSIAADKTSVIPLPASGLALVTALLGLAWRRKL